MPYLLRFLLLSAAPKNGGRIISQIREQIKFVGAPTVRMTQRNRLKGKSVVNNMEALILDALRSSLRFKNVLLSTYVDWFFVFLRVGLSMDWISARIQSDYSDMVRDL